MKFFDKKTKIAVMGEYLITTDKNSVTDVPVIASPVAGPCVILGIVDSTDPKFAAIGHFDTPLHTAVTVKMMLTQLNRDPKNLKVQLAGGVSKMDCLFNSASIYEEIMAALNIKGVSNITHDDYSYSALWTNLYDMGIDRRTGKITVIANDLNSTEELAGMATQGQLKFSQDRNEFNPNPIEPTKKECEQLKYRAVKLK